MLISKTTFLEFQVCSRNTWLKLHRREPLHQFELSEFDLHLVEQGNEFETFARNLRQGGAMVALGGEDGRLLNLRDDLGSRKAVTDSC
jgi:hypothetical protein